MVLTPQDSKEGSEVATSKRLDAQKLGMFGMSGAIALIIATNPEIKKTHLTRADFESSYLVQQIEAVTGLHIEAMDIDSRIRTEKRILHTNEWKANLSFWGDFTDKLEGIPKYAEVTLLDDNGNKSPMKNTWKIQLKNS